MVNAFDKVLRRASWRQSRAEPLEDPNNSGIQRHNDVVDPEAPLSFVFPHSPQPHHHHAHFPPGTAVATSSSPHLPGGGPAPVRASTSHRASFHPDVVTPFSNNNNIINNNNNVPPIGANIPDPAAAATEPKEPLRRGMTRADTKISLRKSKKDSRRIFVNLPLPTQDLDARGNPKVSYGSNRIKTAKYTSWNFLPKNLFEQFRRVANMFFLFMAILQLTPIFTVGSPFLTVFPLCFVVGVTAIKDGFEDYKRHVEDRNYNQRLVLQLKNIPNYNYPNAGNGGSAGGGALGPGAWLSNIYYAFHSASKKTLRALHLKKKATRELRELDLDDLPQIDETNNSNVIDDSAAAHQQKQQALANNKERKPAEFIKEQWANIRVGDLIMLKNNQPVPADAIILATSEAEGSCFIETKDLDGETNLKTRVSLHETSKYTTPRRCSRLRCFIDMEPVNANLYSCNGTLTMVSRRRPDSMADLSGGGGGGHGRHLSRHSSRLNRYSTYSASITSSMLSSPRHSLEEEEQQQGGSGGGGAIPLSTLESAGAGAGAGTESSSDPDRPALGGTDASEYAKMHRPLSRSRHSQSHGHGHGHGSSSSSPPPSGDGGIPPGKQELVDDDENKDEAGPATPPKPFGHRVSTFIHSKRESLHRSHTKSSMGGVSELAKNVLRNQHMAAAAGGGGGTSTPPSRNNTLLRRKTTLGQSDKYREKSLPVDINNMLLRGHVVRNTHWVIAVVVATGTETKIMLNSGETPSKRSRIEKTMNVQVAINFAILVVLCIIVAVGSSINDREWRGTSAGQLWMPQTRGVTLAGVVTFFSSLIIFQNIIPISLYISIEFVKTFQAYFIWQDTDMYDTELGQFCKPKTWNLTDDLGQVEYVFSDKTGTLTRNVMEFKKCTINGKIYGNNAVAGKTDGERGQEMMQQGNNNNDEEASSGATHTAVSGPVSEEQEKLEKDKVLKEYDHEIRQIFEPTYVDAPELLSFADPGLLRDLSGKTSSSSSSSPSGNNNNNSSMVHYGGLTKEYTHDGSGSQNIRDFFTLLALCHTVVIEQPEEEIEDDEDDDYGMYEEGQSPEDDDADGGSSLDENRQPSLKQQQQQQQQQQGQSSFGGVFGKLRQKAEGRGSNSNNNNLNVPGTASNISTGTATSGSRPRRPSNAANNNPLDDGRPKPTLIYRAESPDEAALVAAAKNVGYAFVSRGAAAATTSASNNAEGAGGDQATTPKAAAAGGKAGGNSRQNINVNFLGKDYTYEQLDVIKFNSTRKRQTVIVREPQELGGRILLLTKGADNVIYERLTKEPSSAEEGRIREQTERDIEAFSNMGLRTLTLAQRLLDQQTYDDWARRYAEAGKALEDRARKVDEVAEEIEGELTLLGATAIEDKLQDGVPDAIASLREAGIKVWVLTGDKLETAINIGFASRLLEKNMKLEIMRMGRKESPEAVLKRFKTLVDAVLHGKSYHESPAGAGAGAGAGEKAEITEEENTSGDGGGSTSAASAAAPVWNEKSLPPSPSPSAQARDRGVEQDGEEGEEDDDDEGLDGAELQHALIVDGAALKVLLDDQEARKDLIRLSDECYSVICCRASPLQKALVVELIRRGKKTVCLAIGDGANDVSMIQAANIGVGIAGQEGMQAAMASDYSITQFRFVKKLVLVHGHWGYMRIAEMILNFFFKNIIWVGAVLWFQIYCGFSAYIFYDYTFVALYNLMFTAVPVLVLGATDQDLTAPYVLRFPGVYRLGIQQKRYTQWRFVLYLLDGLWQSAVVFWFWRGVYGVNLLRTNGIDASLLEFSTSVAVSNIIIASLYVGLHAYHWTWLMHFAVWGSIVFLVLLIVLYGLISSSPIYHVAFALFAQGPFWFMTALSIVAALLVRYTVLFVVSWWFPDDVHIVRGIILKEKLDAKAQGKVWTGYGDDGTQPLIQSKEEKAVLAKEDRENEEKAVAKAIVKDLKAAQREGRHPRDELVIRKEVVAGILDEREKNYGKPASPLAQTVDQQQQQQQQPAVPYSVPTIQTSEFSDQRQQQHSNHNTLVPGSSIHSTMSGRPVAPVPPQKQELEQMQRHFMAANAAHNGELKPGDPNYQHSKRFSSYSHQQPKEAALPPVPSPSLPSLPTTSSTPSLNASHHQLPPPTER
ncbi:hypothetical protein DFQ26_009294 [Actinomortierella ambigua]|nr:hypothetical protein DFQ26_009294 [Actinomortierella ambigua]